MKDIHVIDNSHYTLLARCPCALTEHIRLFYSDLTDLSRWYGAVAVCDQSTTF